MATLKMLKAQSWRWMVYFAMPFILCAPVHASDDVLVLRTDAVKYEEVYLGIKDSLEGEEIALHEISIRRGLSDNEIKRYLDRYKPKLLVTIGDKPLEDLRRFKQANLGFTMPEGLALAALYVDKKASGMQGITGILYEIPAVIGLINARSLTNKSIKKVGVIHRSWMTDYIDLNEKYCQREGIKLIRLSIDDDEKNLPKAVAKALPRLQKKVDAIWVPNDDRLLHKEVMQEGWRVSIDKFDGHVVVNDHNLVSNKMGFGTFAVFPDHYGLGEQAASKILDMQFTDWKADDNEFDLPISVKKLLNMRIAEKREIDINQESLNALDHVILNHRIIKQ